MAEEDMIYGKQRHFFGGMEPSGMKKFTITPVNRFVRLDVQLPDDTVVDGQTLCTVAGAVIRRKTSGYPKDEFDGDFVMNVTESGMFTDSTAIRTETYFYAAFPYSAQGVYNRDPENVAVLNGPDNLVIFSAAWVYDPLSKAVKVQLTCDLPDTITGAVIRRRSGAYPVSETDGDAVMTVTADGKYLDEDVSLGNSYFYAAFPYVTTGVYGRDPVNRAAVTIPEQPYGYFFGYDLDTTDSDPATRVSYPEEVQNAGYTPLTMDFTNYSSSNCNYGSWPSTPGEKFMPKPCVLKFDGTVAYYLDPADYTKKEDGTDSKIEVYEGIADIGNVMMEWPKIYTKRWEENGVYHFRCSDTKLDEDYDCWSNYDKNDQVIEHFYTAVYDGHHSSGKLRSYPLGYTETYYKDEFLTSQATAITDALANGEDWYIEVLADHLLIQDLLVMLAKSTSGRKTYGLGYGDRTYTDNPEVPGHLRKYGMFYGKNKDTTTGVVIFGMEHWWGNQNRYLAGWINDAGAQKVKLTRGTHDGSEAADYNWDGTGYLTVVPAGTLTSGGYITKMKTAPYGRFPSACGGSATTYECDWCYPFATDAKYSAHVGAPYALSFVDSTSGPFGVSMGHWYDTSFCARLSCKPSAK